jgi:hypothetical protein
MHCAFDHKVAHFVVMERLHPGCASRHAQPAWLADDLGRLPADAQIVMLTHRPTFRSLSALGLGNHPWRAGHSNAHRAEKRSTRRARPDHARHSDALECSKLPRAYGHCSRCRIPGLHPDAGCPRRFAFNVRQSESACRIMAVDVLVDDRCVRGCARRQGIVGADRELILARPVIF